MVLINSIQKTFEVIRKFGKYKYSTEFFKIYILTEIDQDSEKINQKISYLKENKLSQNNYVYIQNIYLQMLKKMKS